MIYMQEFLQEIFVSIPYRTVLSAYPIGCPELFIYMEFLQEIR